MNPARSTDSCHTPVSRRTPPRTIAPKPPKNASELRSASATARWRMTAGSMMGLGWRNERTTTPAPATAASAKAPMIRPLVQPQSEPSTMPATRLATATVSRPAPRRSDLWASGSRTSSSRRTPSTSASDAEGQVDEEHPTPARLHQEPADRWAERGGRPADRRPQADGRPLAGRAEGGEQQPERGGQHEGAAGGLEDPGADEEFEARSDGAQSRRGGEDPQPEQEGPLAAGPVGPAPGRHQDGGEDDGVRAQHPRQRAQALPVVSGRDAGEGDVDDEQVERRQEHPGQDDEGGQHRSGTGRHRRWALG